MLISGEQNGSPKILYTVPPQQSFDKIVTGFSSRDRYLLKSKLGSLNGLPGIILLFGIPIATAAA